MSLKRQTDILHAVKEVGSYSITDLAEKLRVSTETIRRNIKPMIENGALIRFHGGIMDPDHVEEPPFQRRMQVNKEAKRTVAAMIARLVKDGDSLILDNGTTTTYVAEALAHRHSNLTIVTNSAEIVCRLASRGGNRVFMTGGEISGDAAAAFGPSSIDFVQQFEVKYAFISTGGINDRGELVDFHLFEAEFSRAAMKQAQETWVIVDASKFGRGAPVKVCELSAIDAIVCDEPPPDHFQRKCDDAEVRVLTASESLDELTA